MFNTINTATFLAVYGELTLSFDYTGDFMNILCWAVLSCTIGYTHSRISLWINRKLKERPAEYQAITLQDIRSYAQEQTQATNNA